MPRTEEKEAPREITAKSAYIALLYASPVFVLFLFLKRWEMGIGAWACGGLVALVIRSRWDLRRHIWFWATMLFTVVIQAPIVLLIPWGDRNLTYITLLPVAALDLGIIYGSVKIVETLMGKRNRTRP